MVLYWRGSRLHTAAVQFIVPNRLEEPVQKFAAVAAVVVGG